MREYVLPASSDRAENQRLDRQHALLLKTFGGLVRSPIDKHSQLKVLDVACGTGSWSVDFAHSYPQASIIGFDASSYKTWDTAPSRCSFMIGDMGDEQFWKQLPQDFDLIHARFITAACHNWPGLVEHCCAHLKTGGWLEMQDFEFPMSIRGPKTSSTSKWDAGMNAGFTKAGLDSRGIGTVQKSLQQAGFTEISSDKFKMIFDTHSNDPEEQELGRLGLENLRHGIHGFSNALFTKVLGMTDEEEAALSNATLQELESGQVSAYLPITVSYGKKAS